MVLGGDYSNNYSKMNMSKFKCCVSNILCQSRSLEILLSSMFVTKNLNILRKIPSIFLQMFEYLSNTICWFDMGLPWHRSTLALMAPCQWFIGTEEFINEYLMTKSIFSCYVV